MKTIITNSLMKNKLKDDPITHSDLIDALNANIE
jgi:hypothetical protein